MASTIGSLTRKATRTGPLNILTACTHESYESNLCKTNHNFFAYRCPQVKDWNRSYRSLPSNYTLLNPSRLEQQIPADVEFDCVLAQNRFGQFQILAPIAKRLHLPLITIEHTQPAPSWPRGYLHQFRFLRGDLNLFISDFSRREWGWSEKDESVRVIHHGIDANLFRPGTEKRKQTLLSVVNDWINRDWCCGFKLWQQVSQGLDVTVIGDTPGLSLPAKSVHELALRYRSSRIFLNTSLVSPIPTALLEGMASGCAVVSTATSMIPEVIKHGVNGFISNDPTELRGYCELLLRDEVLAKKLGEAARQTILEHFTIERFVRQWDSILKEASSLPFLG